MAAAELQGPRHESNVLGDGVRSLNCKLVNPLDMLLKRRLTDSMPGTVIDHAIEWNTLFRKRLFDEQVRGKVGIFVAHYGHNRHHSGVCCVVDRIDKVQHLLLPWSQRGEPNKV